MNFSNFKPSLYRGLVALAIGGSLLLSACGGSGSSSDSNQSAGVGGTGIVAGKTTGFGSIYVNGSRYETDMSQFIVDGDDTASQNDLAVGMYVLLKVKTLNGDFTNEALEVIYDDEVQGPVAGITPVCPCPGETQRTFAVYGQNVTIDETSTIYDGTTFTDLTDGRLVEISGFRTSASDIVATYVEDKGAVIVGSEVELRGTISGLAGVAPNQTFQLDGATINTNGATILDLDSGMLQDNLYVEVEGTFVNATTVTATEVEEEDDAFGSDLNDVSLQGVISNFTSASDFEIDGQPINAGGAAPTPTNALSLLGNGVEVEVEGDIDVNGVLIADELELRDGDSELRTTIRAIELSNNRFQVEFPDASASLGTVWVNVDGQTLFEDEAGAMPVPNLSLDQLSIGNFVKVKGRAVVNPVTLEDEVNAEIVKRRDPGSVKLEGVVQAKDRLVSFTILGITYPVDPAATYGGPILAGDFFDAVVVDTSIIELEDDDPVDGDAEEIEFDN